MDNKLSELKDVVDYWRKVKSGELPAPGPNEISITVCTLDGAASRIAALLAELEAKDSQLDAEIRAWTQKYVNAMARIADLESCSRLEYTRRIERENAELKAKLAAQVRLPELCGDGENDNEYTEGLNDGINQSAKAIRAAGFTVEGDE